MTDEWDETGRTDWGAVLAYAVAAIAALTIVALILMLGSTTRERDAALVRQQHSYDVMILARTLDATMGQSEAMLGRFVISGDKQLGRRYFDDWRRAGTIIDRLDREIDDRATQPFIDSLRTAYTIRGNELAAVALRTNYKQNPEALSKYYAAGSSKSLKDIDVLLEIIGAGERRLLADRSRVANASIGRSNEVGAIVSVVGIFLVVGAALLGWAMIQSFAERRAGNRRNQDLEFFVAERTSELSDANARLHAEIGERAVAEATLRQVQKMEAVGQLTGGIAHDFNNMLAVVIGGIELARRRIASGGADVDRHLENAMEGANRAAALTKRLLGFARVDPISPVATDPNLLVVGMSELLDRTIGDPIEVRIVHAAEIWPVFVDRNQLENALLNLSVNARDAMEHGGTLTVEVANVVMPEGDCVRLSVADTGSGMTREVIERIFEPFYTTKAVGKGTGLGLSQIFGFVRQSGGTISVDSVPDMGTTVSLYFPRHMSSAITLAQPVASATKSRHAPRTVLVIEDDPRVLAATVGGLQELGHRTIPCAMAADAFDLLRQHREIDLIVSDVLMPGVTGPELVAQLRSIYPDLPVLFVTGFTGNLDEERAFGGHDVLRKPFTIGALDAAVRNVLDNLLPAARAA